MSAQFISSFPSGTWVLLLAHILLPPLYNHTRSYSTLHSTRYGSADLVDVNFSRLMSRLSPAVFECHGNQNKTFRYLNKRSCQTSILNKVSCYCISFFDIIFTCSQFPMHNEHARSFGQLASPAQCSMQIIKHHLFQTSQGRWLSPGLVALPRIEYLEDFIRLQGGRKLTWKTQPWNYVPGSWSACMRISIAVHTQSWRESSWFSSPTNRLPRFYTWNHPCRPIAVCTARTWGLHFHAPMRRLSGSAPAVHPVD